jgi:Protein of unknown function (DUF3306)
MQSSLVQGDPSPGTKDAPPRMKPSLLRIQRTPSKPMPSLPIDAEDSGFLSRWSRRKAMVRQGADVQDVAPPTVAEAPVIVPVPVPVNVVEEATPLVVRAAPEVADSVPAPATVEAEPALTLDDVAALTRDSNFARFVRPGVQPEVKNAALSKLFTDPHFNVMDRLDTYIDDYGKPDPLPEGMLRQMLQAHVLGLFDHEKTHEKTHEKEDEDKSKNKPTGPTTDLADDVQPACDAAPPTELPADENTDLQLQPDDGAGRPGAESGAGQNAGCAH